MELPNVQLIDCQEAGLSVRYDKCLRIKFTNLEEYAGLIEVGGTPDVLVGKLYGIDGAVNVDSRVSVSIDEDIYYVRHYLHTFTFLTGINSSNQSFDGRL